MHLISFFEYGTPLDFKDLRIAGVAVNSVFMFYSVAFVFWRVVVLLVIPVDFRSPF